MLSLGHDLYDIGIASLRFSRQCFVCGMDKVGYLTLDHFYPSSKGGENGNYSILCNIHNQGKGNKHPLDYYGEEHYNTCVRLLELQFTDEEVAEEISIIAQKELDEMYSAKVWAQSRKIFLERCLNNPILRKKRKKTKNEALIKKVLKLVADGKSHGEISKKYGIHINTIKKWMSRA